MKNRSRPRAPLWTLTALAAAMSTAFAQEAPRQEREMGTVIVTGNRPTSLPTQIPTTIETVTGEEIARAINASDAEDALKYLPSLLVRKRYIGDYNHAVLSTRASGTGNSARSAVYADGILLSNYLGNGASFAPRWGMVSPEEIERVDVLYGPFSAAYGGNSVGAVVDYVTRMPSHFEAHAKFAASYQPFRLYGTDDTYHGRQGSISLGNRAGAWSWYLDVSKLSSDGQPLTFPTRYPAATASDAGTPVSGAVPGRDRTGRDWLILGTATQYQTTQDHVKAKLAYDFSPPARDLGVRAVGQRFRRAAADLAARRRRPAGLQRRGEHRRPRLYAGAGRLQPVERDPAPPDARPDPEEQHPRRVRLGACRQPLRLRPRHPARAHRRVAGRREWRRGAHRRPGRHRLAYLRSQGRVAAAGPGGAHVAEFGWQREAYKLRSIENATADWIAGSPGARNQAFSGRTAIDALYAQDTWKFAPRWKTVLGLRAERWEAREGKTSNATASISHGSRREDTLSPKAALAFQVTDAWLLKASLGRAVRMPTVSELYQGGINAAGTLINNDPNLKPEKSWTGELTAERKLEGDPMRGQLRLTVFGERTRDALYSQTNVLVVPNVTNVQNVDRIVTKGLEAAYAASDVGLRGLDLNASLTWTDSKIDRNDKFPASVGKWQPRIPEWRAAAQATWRVDDRLAATLAARYSGPQYSTLDNSDTNGFAYQGASKYFTADLRLVYRIDRQWSAAVGIDNLNNYRYWNFHPYPQRTWVAELKWDL
jgi:iron complex outermembrane receptor protein